MGNIKSNKGDSFMGKFNLDQIQFKNGKFISSKKNDINFEMELFDPNGNRLGYLGLISDGDNFMIGGTDLSEILENFDDSLDLIQSNLEWEMDQHKNKFQFTDHEKRLIMEEIDFHEKDYGKGEMTILQLFENDCLISKIITENSRRKIFPTYLNEIDFDFTGRKFE